MFIPSDPQQFEGLKFKHPVMWANDIPLDPAKRPWSVSPKGSLYMYMPTATWYRKVADNKDANDWVDALFTMGYITDAPDWPATPDGRYGRLEAENSWAETQLFLKNPSSGWYDYSSRHASALAFDDFAPATPVEFVEHDPADLSKTNLLRGFWTFFAYSTNTSFDYSWQPGFDIENDFTAFQYSTPVFGPIYWREIGYTEDIDLSFWVHADNAGSFDANNYIKTTLSWDATASEWSVQSHLLFDGLASSGAKRILDKNPLQQGLFFRFPIRGGDVVKATYGQIPYAMSHSQIHSTISRNTTMGEYHLRVTINRGAGALFWLYLGGIDFGTGG